MDLHQLIYQHMNTNAATIARHLLPAGKLVGNEWTIGDVAGNLGRSLKICISGSKTAVWKDFASGEGGDLFSLWQTVQNESTPDAIRSV